MFTNRIGRHSARIKAIGGALFSRWSSPKLLFKRDLSALAPQTASVGVSTSKFVRKEGDVIRHNMGWTFILLAYLILIAIGCYLLHPLAMSLPQ